MFQVGLLRCASAIVYCSDKRESVRALLGNGFVIRRTCSFIQSFAFSRELVFLTNQDCATVCQIAPSPDQRCYVVLSIRVIERVHWVLCLPHWHHRVLLNPQCHLT